MTIEELEKVHSRHVNKLKEIHEEELKDLQKRLQKSQQECKELRHEREKGEEEIKRMREEVDVLRQSFDLVQERLKRVLIDQDDLIRILQLIDQQQLEKEPNISESTTSTLLHRKLSEIDSKTVEEYLSSQDSSDESTRAARQALKYFKKVEASDPIHLCRLLEIPFCPDRSLALSSSLLKSIALHMGEDPSARESFYQAPLYQLLLNEIVGLRRDVNELSRLALQMDSKWGKSAILEDITTRAGRSDGSRIAELIIKAHDEKIHNNNNNKNGSSNNLTNALLTSFLSTFK